MSHSRFVKFIPNLLTLGNLFLGCLGILFCFNDQVMPVEALEPDQQGSSINVIFGFNNRLHLASLMIFAGAILDFFDGSVARWLHANSEIGKQLDSLADATTFGLLPACIYYQLLAGAFYALPSAFYVPGIVLWPALLIALTAVYRLAKFNVDERQQHGFIGLATPASALFAASLPLILFANSFNLAPWILNPWFLYGCIVLFSVLMVSGLPMFSLKLKMLQWKGNQLVYLFIAACIVLIVFFAYAGMAVSILLYIIINLVTWLGRKKIYSQKTPDDLEPQHEN